MHAPPLVLDKPLGKAVGSVLGDEPVKVMVVGSARLATVLEKKGHAVTLRRTPEGVAASVDSGPDAPPTGALFDTPPLGFRAFDALVLVQVLGRRPEPLRDLERLVRSARPGALVVLAEQAAWGRGGQWFGRLAGRLLGRPLVTDASELGALCLNAGLTDLRQSWPQGLRSLVLTTGRVHGMANTLA